MDTRQRGGLLRSCDMWTVCADVNRVENSQGISTSINTPAIQYAFQNYSHEEIEASIIALFDSGNKKPCHDEEEAEFGHLPQDTDGEDILSEW